MSDKFHTVNCRMLAGPRETLQRDTTALRETFLAQDLFGRSELRLVLTDMDRLALGGVMPRATLCLPPCREFGTSYFTERRELGVVNLGEPGHVCVGDQRHSLDSFDFLYVGAGNERVAFESCGDSQPCFCFFSCPAHQRLPAVRIGHNEISLELIGGQTMRPVDDSESTYIPRRCRAANS